MTFNESNTVEAFIRDHLAGATARTSVSPGLAREGARIYGLGLALCPPRQPAARTAGSAGRALSARSANSVEPRHRCQSFPVWMTYSTVCEPSSWVYGRTGW